MSARPPGHGLRGTPIAVLAGGLALAACGGGQSGGSPGSVSPSASPSTAPISPAVAFRFPGGTAPTVARQQTGLDERYINPGAILEHEGRLHMFANVFTAWPGPVQVPHLTSSDGVSWTLDSAQPALTSAEVPYANPGADVSTGFVTDDGAWVLIFETVSRSEPWAIGRATAPSAQGPWSVDPEPILVAGPKGSWDAGGLAWPSVVRTSDGYAMFYSAFDAPRGSGVIAMATSPDGTTWTKLDHPVLEAALEWEGGSLDRPRAAVTPAGLVMVYAGADLTDRGVAWSADEGLTWRRDGSQPAITAEDFPVDGRAWDAALLYRDGILRYYLEIGTASGTDGTHIYQATAALP